VLNPVDYGAKPDERTLCTAAIQRAIDACAAGGGGTVRLPKGAFLSGALRLRSGVALELDEGATLLGSRDLNDYFGPPTDAEGREAAGEPVFRNLLHGEHLHDVAISGCRVDSDDDGIVLKSLSSEPCHDVTITDCVVSSHCNALKMGTESGGGFVGVTIARCKVASPKESKAVHGRQRGLAGIALEIVDGGRLEDVTVSDVAIEGVSVPIFLRLGNRARVYGKGAKPGVGTFRGVKLANITATGTSNIGCSITGLPGHPIENVTLSNVSLGFEGGGTRDEATRQVPEREKDYPESTMFGNLPAYGFYCRHVRGVTFTNLTLRTDKPDLRHALAFDDAQDIVMDGLDAQFSPGAAAMIHSADVQRATLRACSPKSPVDLLLRLKGAATRQIVVEKCDLSQVRKLAASAPGVPDDAVEQR